MSASTATTVRYTAPGGDSHRDTRVRVLTGSTAVYLAATNGQPCRARARALRAFAKAAEARPKPSFNTVCLCAAPRRDASSVTKRRRCLGLWVHAAGVPDLLLGRFAHVGGIGCCTSRARARCLRLVHSYAFFRHRVRSLPEPFSSSALKKFPVTTAPETASGGLILICKGQVLTKQLRPAVVSLVPK